jgi:hypothetical protein
MVMQGVLQFVMLFPAVGEVTAVGVFGLLTVPPDPNFKTTKYALEPLDWIKATFVPSAESIGEVVAE